MKRFLGGFALAVIAGHVMAAVLIPPAPTLSAVPLPTDVQLNTTPTVVLPTLQLSSDQQAAMAVARAWVLAVGPVQSLSTASTQVSTLCAQGFSAFLQPLSNQTAQVMIGPEVALTHLQETQKALSKAFPVLSTTIVPYTVPHLAEASS